MKDAAPKWRRPIVGIAMPTWWQRQLARKQSLLSVPNTLMDAARQAGVSAYMFALDEVQAEGRKIRGWVRANGKWRLEEVPWPDIYYEIPALETNAQGLRIIRALRRTTIPINTARRIGKWQAYAILQRDSHLKGLLPDTVQYRSPHDLLKMLRQYGMVFAKPENGQEGKGISRVWVIPNHLFAWEHAVTRRKETNLTLDQVIARIKASAWHGPVVLQRAIQLFHLGDRPADMRITMHKNKSGQWTVSFAKLRVAAPRRFITHANRGGSWHLFPKGLRLVFPDQTECDRWLTRLYSTAKVIVRRLEQQLGPMGEIGLDMTFDRDYRLWFFEANANPAKITGIVRRVGDPAPPWYIYLMEYARYLWQHKGRKGK